MRNRRAALVLAVLAAGFAPRSAAAGGDEAPSVEGVVTQRVAEAVGRPVGAVFTVAGSSGAWRFVCGRPLEPDGAPFDIGRSALAATGSGADFCALVSVAGGVPEVVEFDIGSSDMPAVDWVARHRLPMAILSGR